MSDQEAKTHKSVKELILKRVAQLINIAMIILSYLFIANNLFPLAILVFVLSKWRIFFTRIRLWFTNFVNSLCDISFGLSALWLMDLYFNPADPRISMLLAGLLFIWQLILKPLNSHWAVRLQAVMCLGVANTTIWTLYADPDSTYGLLAVVLSMVAAYASGRHVLRQIDAELVREEIRNKLLAVWVFIAGQLAWFFWLWNVNYNLRVVDVIVPQAAIVFCLIFSYLGSILVYKPNNEGLEENDEKIISTRRFMVQQTVFYSIIMVIIILFTEWNRSIQ